MCRLHSAWAPLGRFMFHLNKCVLLAFTRDRHQARARGCSNDTCAQHSGRGLRRRVPTNYVLRVAPLLLGEHVAQQGSTRLPAWQCGRGSMTARERSAGLEELRPLFWVAPVASLYDANDKGRSWPAGSSISRTLARNEALQAGMCTIFRCSVPRFGSGAAVPGPDAIASGPRTSAPRPTSPLKKRNLEKQRVLSALFRARFRLAGRTSGRPWATPSIDIP